MSIHILAVGKKHEPWVEPGIERFLARLRPPFHAQFDLLPHSGKTDTLATEEESERMLRRLKPEDFVILLDERGKNLSSPELSELLVGEAGKTTYLLIGGAYGVSDAVRQRADTIWSLSRLVFPHQLVRLLVSEQLYRAQEIAKGSPYHHQ